MFIFYLINIIVITYVLLLVYVIYGVNYPLQCNHGNKLNEFCLTPIYHKNERINIKLFITSPGKLDRKHTSKPRWQVNNISILSEFSSEFYINLSTITLNYQKNILVTILIEKYSTFEKDYINWDSILIPVSFTIFKKVKSKSIYKDLLSTNGTVSNIVNSPNNYDLPRPHWKYATHPLLIRLVSYGDMSLGHSFLPNLVEQLDTRQVNQYWKI